MSEPHTWATLPLPPSTNALHAPRRGGGKRRSDAYAAWMDAAGKSLLVARSEGMVKPIRAGWYHVEILVAVSCPLDVDNVAKATLDLLHRMQATPDDRHCWGVLVERSARVEPGMCVVRTWPVFEMHAEGVSRDVPA